jgi:hypothetical protein
LDAGTTSLRFPIKRRSVKDWQKRGIVPSRIKVLLGDQSDTSVVQRWVKETDGGHFDIIIDDGGHSNLQIYNSFQVLWPTLNDGGLYFIEDLQVSRRKDKEDSQGKFIMADIIEDWIEQLMMPRRLGWTHKIPRNVRWIMCQNHACVVAKCYADDIACSRSARGEV